MTERPCIIKGCVNLADWSGSSALCERCYDEMTGTPVNVWQEYIQPPIRWAWRKVHVALMGWSA